MSCHICGKNEIHWCHAILRDIEGAPVSSRYIPSDAPVPVPSLYVFHRPDPADTIYYIVKHGVYEHGVIGVYRTVEEAATRCEQYTAADPKREGDGYHHYAIYRSALGVPQRGDVVAVWKGTTQWDGHTRLPGAYTWTNTL